MAALGGGYGRPSQQATQQQQSFTQLLRRNGFKEEVPASFFAAIPAGSDLLKWLATALDDANFVAPADIALAEEYRQSRQELPAASDGAGPAAGPAPPHPWPSTPGAAHAEAEAALRALQADHARMARQLQELQGLERGLQAAEGAERGDAARSEPAAGGAARCLAVEAAGLGGLGGRLNGSLAALEGCIKELQQLVAVHGRRWLLLASSMDGYVAEDKRFVDTIMHFTARVEADQGPSLGAGLPAGGAAAEGVALDEAAIQELKRLRMAYYLSEMEHVAARAHLAGAQHMAAALEAMLVAPMGASSASAPWLDERACAALAVRVRALEQERERLLHSDLPALVTQLAQLQDTYVFQGEGALKQAQLQRRIGLMQRVVDALVAQGARHLVVDAMRQREQAKLQEVLGLVQAVGAQVDGLSRAAHARSALYVRPAALDGMAPTGPGTSPNPSLCQHLDSMLQAIGGAAGAGGAAGPQLAQQPHRLPKHAVQTAQALVQLQAGLQAALTGVQAVSGRLMPAQVEAATDAARAVRAVLFPPGAPEGTGGEGGAAGAGRAAQQPVMAPPDLSAALHQLSSLNEELQAATNEIVMGYQEHTARLERHKADAALERSVLKLFHLDPEKLQDTVTELQARLDALTG